MLLLLTWLRGELDRPNPADRTAFGPSQHSPANHLQLRTFLVGCSAAAHRPLGPRMQGRVMQNTHTDNRSMCDEGR